MTICVQIVSMEIHGKKIHRMDLDRVPVLCAKREDTLMRMDCAKLVTKEQASPQLRQTECFILVRSVAT
jgi:hypothetical protein